MKTIIKIFTGLLLVLILLVLGLWAYRNFYTHAYSDSRYGFVIKDQREWFSVPAREGTYYSAGTTAEDANGKVVSYFGVKPINHMETNMSEDFEIFKEDCIESSKQNNQTTLDVSLTTVNNLQGFLCMGEGKAINTDAIYILKNYILINNDGKFDYVISTSYPKGDMVEEKKVDRILNSFFAK